MKTLIKVTLIALLWIISVNSGIIYGDTERRLQITHAWLTNTDEVVLPENYIPKTRTDIKVGVLGVAGKRYAPYEVGQSLLMLPGDWLAIQLDRLFPQIGLKFLQRLVINFLIFIPLNVVAIVTCFWLLKLFSFTEKTAGLASITWLISTTVLHYAQINQQNNQLLLFVTVSYAGILAWMRSSKILFVFLSGFGLGASILIRTTSVFDVLTVFLFFVSCLFYQKKFNKIEIIQILGIWVTGLIPLTLVGRVFDYFRFGSLLATAGSTSGKLLNSDPIFTGLTQLPPNYPFINSPLVGILGVLFSPAKSIFIYDPLFLPCLLLSIFLWKHISPYIKLYLLAVSCNFCLQIALTSKLDFWHGDFAWGARYHVTSVHLLLIPLIALAIEYCCLNKKNPKTIVSGTIILLIAILVQISSVVLEVSAEKDRVFFASPSTFVTFRLGERFTNISCLLNSSLANDCVERLTSKNLVNKINFFPFKFSNARSLILIVWIGIVIAAIVLTCRWFLQSF